MCLDHGDLIETLVLQSSHSDQLMRLLHTGPVQCGCTQFCSHSFVKAFFSQFIRNVKAWCSRLFILGVLLPYTENRYIWPFIQSLSNKQTLKAHTEAHRHISDSDMVYFPSLITYRVCCQWYTLNVNENVWDILTSTASPRSVSESALHFSHCVSVWLFLTADRWHSTTVCFCHSNKSPLNQSSCTNWSVIYSGDILIAW